MRRNEILNHEQPWQGFRDQHEAQIDAWHSTVVHDPFLDSPVDPEPLIPLRNHG